MTKKAWIARLEGAIKSNWIDSGRSMRKLSLATGNGPNYISQMINDNKEPSVDELLKISELINVSVSFILLGIEMGPEDEKLLILASKLGPDQKRSFLDILNSIASSGTSQPSLSPSAQD